MLYALCKNHLYSPNVSPYTEPMKSPAFDGIIFDIDNVLIDTRKSYMDAIRWTIEIYLTYSKVPFFHKNKDAGTSLLLTAHDVDRFKLLGGFNDDWDCCYGLLHYLLSIDISKKTLTELRSHIDIKGLAKKLPARPLGVNGIVKAFGRSSHVLIEKISRIFQEIYLGKELFEATENKRAFYWKKRGLIYRERLIFKRTQLEKLRASGISLGIATGRPKFEAVFSLKHFGVLDCFDFLTTMDEVKKAEREQKQSLRKPHPFSLLETARELRKAKRFLYVGDLPDDILAAHQAKKTINIKAAAFPAFTSDPRTAAEELKKTKPDFILSKPADLIKHALSSHH